MFDGMIWSWSHPPLQYVGMGKVHEWLSELYGYYEMKWLVEIAVLTELQVLVTLS
jgi:hypothetical protein